MILKKYTQKIKERTDLIRLYKKEFYNYPFLICNLLNLSSNNKVTFMLRNGTKFRGRLRSLDYLIIKETYINQSYIIPGFEIKDDDIVIDIGAHIGSFAIYASKQAGKGQVYAYEPEPENYSLLVENIELNNCCNVKAFKTGVMLTGRFELNIRQNQAAHTFVKILNSGVKKLIIDCISLQGVFDVNKIDRCNFLKIDAEGSEYDILFNLPDSYFKRIEKIALEYHLMNSEDKEKLNKLEQLLKRLEYNVIERKECLKGLFFAKKL